MHRTPTKSIHQLQIYIQSNSVYTICKWKQRKKSLLTYFGYIRSITIPEQMENGRQKEKLHVELLNTFWI